MCFILILKFCDIIIIDDVVISTVLKVFIIYCYYNLFVIQLLW